MTKADNRGFTLTELAIVLGVAGGMLGAVWVASDMVIQNRKSQRAVAQIMEISANVKDLMAMHPGFNATDTKTVDSYLLQSKVFPSDMTSFTDAQGDLALTNPWVGGETKVYRNANGNHPDTFRVSYYGVPASACTTIASNIIVQSGTLDADPIEVIVNNGLEYVDLGTQSLEPASIATLCANDTAASSSIEFDFKMTK